MQQARLRSHVRESAVAIISEKMRRRSFPLRKSLEARAIHQKNIQPAIVIVIVEGNAAAGRLQKILVLMLAAENRFDIKSRFASYVDEINAQASGRRRRRLLCSGRIRGLNAGRIQVLCPNWADERKNILQRKHERRTA